MAYVSVSRARSDAHIYTNDTEFLGYELSRDVSHLQALAQEESVQSQGAREHGKEEQEEIGAGLEID